MQQLSKLYDGLLTGLWKLVESLTNVDQMIFFVVAIFCSACVASTIYMYKEVQRRNAKIEEILVKTKIEQKQIMDEHKKDYREINDRGITVLRSFENAFHEHTLVMTELKAGLENSNKIMDKLIDKIV